MIYKILKGYIVLHVILHKILFKKCNIFNNEAIAAEFLFFCCI